MAPRVSVLCGIWTDLFLVQIRTLLPWSIHIHVVDAVVDSSRRPVRGFPTYLILDKSDQDLHPKMRWIFQRVFVQRAMFKRERLCKAVVGRRNHRERSRGREELLSDIKVGILWEKGILYQNKSHNWPGAWWEGNRMGLLDSKIPNAQSLTLAERAIIGVIRKDSSKRLRCGWAADEEFEINAELLFADRARSVSFRSRR